MFGPGDFGGIKSRGASGALNSLAGLDDRAEMEYMLALRRAQGYKDDAEQAAKTQGKQAVREATEYRDRARNNTIFGTLMGGIGLANQFGAFDGFRAGSGAGGFSAGDAVGMGMPRAQADFIGRGGTTYWDTSMPMDSFKPVRGSFNW